MIINDNHRFVFVHIPKCAGSTVRRRLQPLDQTGGTFANRVGRHSELGVIDFGHIPLFVLRRHFPEEYSKVRSYSAFAIVRNPFERFPSSVSEHVKKSGPVSIRYLSEVDIRAAIEDAIEYLRKRAQPGVFLPREFIHFQRQSDYIFDLGERVVEAVYGIDQIDQLVRDVAARTGVPLLGQDDSAVGRSNQSMVFRSAMGRTVVDAVRPLARVTLPEGLRRWLKRQVMGRLSVPRNERFAHLFTARHVRDFIEEYYADDIGLFEEVTGRMAGELE